MCKIFAMTNMEKVEVTSKFVSIVRDEVCKLSDKDGFGYAVLGQDGTIGGERTVRPMSFKPLDMSPEDKITLKVPGVLKSYNRFGKINTKHAKSFIGHGRFSTNDKTLDNTHPFTNGEIALIHNGVVYDEMERITNLLTTCDSEILLRYWELGGMKQIEENVTGYYALAVLDKKGQLHIARDDRAMLHIAYSRTVDSHLIATTPEIIQNVAKRMKWKIERPEEMLDNQYIVFNGNEIVSHRSIKPLEGKFSRHMEAKARAAFGANDFAKKDHYAHDPEAEKIPSYKESLEEDFRYTMERDEWGYRDEIHNDVPDPRDWKEDDEDDDMRYARRFGS